MPINVYTTKNFIVFKQVLKLKIFGYNKYYNDKSVFNLNTLLFL